MDRATHKQDRWEGTERYTEFVTREIQNASCTVCCRDSYGVTSCMCHRVIGRTEIAFVAYVALSLAIPDVHIMPRIASDEANCNYQSCLVHQAHDSNEQTLAN